MEDRHPRRSAQTRRRLSPGNFRNVQQRQFLQKVRDEFILLEDLAAGCNVNEQRLAAWLSRPRFRRGLAGALAVARRRARLELELGGIAGARRLTTMVKSRDYMTARLASLNLVHLHAVSRQAAKRRKAGEKDGEKDGVESQPDPAGPRIHPDCPPEEAERIIADAEARARPAGTNESRE